RLQQRSPIRRAGSPWITVGAFVASAVFAAPASAVEIRRDPRLAVIARALQVHQDPAPAPSAAAPQRFEIPAGPLADVIRGFEQATGIAVSLQLDSLGTIQSPGVSGFFDAKRALDELLLGTSLRARFQTPTLVVVDIDIRSETVDVTGRSEVVASPKY